MEPYGTAVNGFTGSPPDSPVNQSQPDGPLGAYTRGAYFLRQYCFTPNFFLRQIYLRQKFFTPKHFLRQNNFAVKKCWPKIIIWRK